MSDHFTIWLNLNLSNSPKNKPKIAKNVFTSKIAELDMVSADEEDWYRLNLQFNKINWENILEDLSVDESLQRLIDVLVENCTMVFKSKSCFEGTPKESTFKSKIGYLK